MAHILSMGEINNFLPREKLELDTTPVSGQPKDHNKVDDLEVAARSIVHAKLRSLYNVDDWVAHTSIPELVRTIMAMLVAGWVYDRQFAEESAEGKTYGAQKREEAYMLLEGLCEQLLTLDDASPISDYGQPSVLETDPVFEMGRTW